MLYQFDKNSLEYRKVGKSLLIPYVGLLSILLILIILQFSTHKEIEKVHYISEETQLLILNSENNFSPNKLKQYLNSLNLKFPHIIYAQAELETGGFKSRIFKENNNLFGMKVARSRPTTNKGEQYGHAYFNSWKESVLDYAFYQAAYLKHVKTESQYYQYLAANYAEDQNYIIKIKKIVDNEKKKIKS